MTFALFFATSVLLIAATHRFVTPLSRAAGIALLLLPLVFTGRALLTGRVYAPIDFAYITQPLKDHHSEFGIGEPRNPLLSDIAFQMIPWREATRRAIANREWPLLNRFEWCGDPLAASMQPAAWSPFTWIALLLPAALSFTFTAAIAFFVAGLGAFLLARELRCGELASLVAAAIWMFSAPIALQILWPLGFAWTLLPFVLMATQRVIERPRAWPLLTIALALEVVAGHPETLLHVVAVASAFGVSCLVLRASCLGKSDTDHEARSTKHDLIRPLLPIAVAGVVALLLTAIAILPFLDVRQQSTEVHARRVYAGAAVPVDWRASRAALIGDLLPFKRDPRSPAQRVEAGYVPLLLAIFALVAPGNLKVWGRRPRRPAARQRGFAAQAGEPPAPHKDRRTAIFFGALLLVCLAASANVWPIAQLLHALPLFDQALNDRLASVVPLCIALLAAFALDRWPKPIVIAILAIILIERTATDGSLIPTYEEKAAYPPLKLFEPLRDIKESFRIAGRGATFIPNTSTMYGLEDVRGSAAMRFGPLHETFGRIWGRRGAGQFDEVRDLASPFVAMMNVRFALLDVSDPIPAGWRDVTYDVYTRLIENERALPRAFLPRTIRTGDDLEQMANETDFAQRSWIANGEPPQEVPNGTGRVSAKTAKNGLTLDADLENDAWIVVSQANWRGWRAYLDGSRIRTYAANHAFLAIHVPRGTHRVKLVYLPQAFVIGRAISLCTLIFLLFFACSDAAHRLVHRRRGIAGRTPGALPRP